MGNAELKSDLAPADLVRDLALAQEARKRRFASIIRFVRRYEASGPAKDMIGQIRRDHRLCQLLVDYKTESEITGMMEFVRDLKNEFLATVVSLILSEQILDQTL
jgi:hypothetical protein